MEKINHFKKKYIYALPIILLFAFLFRLWTIPSGPLSFDENKYYNRALKTATFEKIDVFGHEIYGKQGSSFTWGGSFIYLFSIPLFFVQTPIAVKVFLALLSTLLIYGLYHLIRRYYSEDTAIYTSLFFAFSPWTIFSSTLIFHNVIILFIVPLLFLFLKGFNDNKRLLIAFIPTVIFMCFSVHATSVALGITAIISYFIYKPKLNLKLILWAFIILLLAMLPTIIYEITTDFSNVKLFIARTAHRDAPYKPETFKIFQWLVTVPSSEIGFLIGRSRDKFISFFKFPYFLFFIPAIIFSIYLVSQFGLYITFLVAAVATLFMTLLNRKVSL